MIGFRALQAKLQFLHGGRHMETVRIRRFYKGRRIGKRLSRLTLHRKPAQIRTADHMDHILFCFCSVRDRDEKFPSVGIVRLDQIPRRSRRKGGRHIGTHRDLHRISRHGILKGRHDGGRLRKIVPERRPYKHRKGTFRDPKSIFPASCLQLRQLIPSASGAVLHK